MHSTYGQLARLHSLERGPWKKQIKLVRVIVPIALGVFLLLLTSWILDALAAQTSTLPALAPGPSLLFSDEFNGSELDLAKWHVYQGAPIVSNGWLTLSGADVQSEPEYSSGILQGVIQSSDWRPEGESTDSSFGYEIWEGADGKCHYGVVFKASGHLGLLRSQPDAEDKCAGQSASIPGRDPDDPLYQDFRAISNWNAIIATHTVAFTLTWSTGVTLQVSGGSSSGQVYAGSSPAIPTVPLKIRLYAQTSVSPTVTDTFMLDYVRLHGRTTYLPTILRQ